MYYHDVEKAVIQANFSVGAGRACLSTMISHGGPSSWGNRGSAAAAAVLRQLRRWLFRKQKKFCFHGVQKING